MLGLILKVFAHCSMTEIIFEKADNKFNQVVISVFVIYISGRIGKVHQ